MRYLREFSALLAPLCWSVAILLYRKVGTSASPEAMTLFKNVVALGLLLLTMAALGEGFPTDRPGVDWLRLALSGILGLAVADTFLFHALKRIGAARVAILDTVYAPIVVTLAWLFLGDVLPGSFLVGGLLVVAGVAVANRQGERSPVDAREALVGSLFCLLAVSGTGVGVILSKPVLEGAHVVEVTATRMGFGVAAQLLWSGLRGDRTVFGAFLPSSGAWRWLLPASFVGTYLAMLLWMGGFKWAPASVAAVLNQLATVYILILARLVLHEPVTGRQFLGGAAAVVGAMVVMWGRAAGG